MSKTYLTNHEFYVKTNENLIYKTESVDAYDENPWLRVNLVLVAGYDYINPDESDIQGYISASNFVDSVQIESVIQYYLIEGMKQCLIDNGYKILDTLPRIHK